MIADVETEVVLKVHFIQINCYDLSSQGTDERRLAQRLCADLVFFHAE